MRLKSTCYFCLEEVKMEEVFEAWSASHAWTLASLRGMEAFGRSGGLMHAQLAFGRTEQMSCAERGRAPALGK